MDEKKIQETIEKILRTSFNKRIGDTPTDSLQLANRRYVNLNGSISGRPKRASTGQQYFSTDINKPIFWSGTEWRDATSSIVAFSVLGGS